MKALNPLLHLIIALSLNYINTKIQVKFDGSCLKQENITSTHKKVVNIYIVDEINLCIFTEATNFTLGNSLFGAVRLTINTDLNKYRYSGHGI